MFKGFTKQKQFTIFNNVKNENKKKFLYIIERIKAMTYQVYTSYCNSICGQQSSIYCMYIDLGG